jgi:hypothetical protein
MKLVKILSTLIGGTAIAAGVLANASPAQALTWTFNNFVLSDGSAVTGAFNYDSSSNAVSAVAETVNLSSSEASQVGASSYNFDGGSTSNGTTFLFTNSGDSSSIFTLTLSQQLLNSIASGTPSGSNASVLALGGAVNTKLVIAGLSAIPLTFPNTTAAVVTPGTGSSGGGTGVPFEVPGGATMPVFGTILALGAMKKFKKSSFVANSVN